MFSLGSVKLKLKINLSFTIKDFLVSCWKPLLSLKNKTPSFPLLFLRTWNYWLSILKYSPITSKSKILLCFITALHSWISFYFFLWKEWLKLSSFLGSNNTIQSLEKQNKKIDEPLHSSSSSFSPYFFSPGNFLSPLSNDFPSFFSSSFFFSFLWGSS